MAYRFIKENGTDRVLGVDVSEASTEGQDYLGIGTWSKEYPSIPQGSGMPGVDWTLEFSGDNIVIVDL